MSDYLSSLVTRHLNPKGELQARLGSIFEPLLPPGGTATGLASDLPGEDGAPAPGEVLAEAQAPTPRPARRLELGQPHEAPGDLPGGSAEAVEGGPGVHAAMPGRRLAERAPEPPAGHLSPALAPLQGHGPDRGPAPSPPTAGETPEQATGDRPTVGPLVTQRQSPAEATADAMAQRGQLTLEPALAHEGLAPRISPAAPRLDRAGEAETRTTARARPAEGEPRPAPEPGPAGEPSSASAAPVTAWPRVTPYLEPAPPAPAVGAAQPEPTIQVTIGRIEVRATPPSPPPPRQRSTPPVMSLEEYLRQRSGERP